MIGNINHRKDGRYEGRIPLRNADGKRKYKAFFGKTADEVTSKMTDFKRNIAISLNDIKPFSVVYDEWFCSIRYRIKKSTAANYTLKAGKHILPVYRNIDITEISPESIYQFIRDKQDSGAIQSLHY